MRKNGLFISLLLVGAMALGCGGAGKTKIGLAISTLNNPFFVDLRDGAQSALEGSADYELVVLDAQDDAAKQASQIEDLVAKKVAVIMVNPVDSTSVGTSIKLANEAGIPVITVDRGAEDGEVAAHVASDNVAGGKMAGEFVVSQIMAGDKVIELEGIPGASAAIDRGKGFNQAMTGFGVIKQVANFNRAEGEAVTTNLLVNNSDVKAIFAHNDEMALGAIAALEAAGLENVLIVGFDATDDARAAVAEGRMAATVAQKPKEIGSLAVQAALKITGGEAVESTIPVALELVK